ncbi:HAD family hydrolase [Saccharothrix sp. HUAS TT1]|uniref:HAD family hydrolase n=1 Tax=unclassified Saccharothrix TaxID=2593673 RepID=UPI00345BCBA1
MKEIIGRVDDIDMLQRILNTTRGFLFDFDGPICSIFANLSASYVAHQLRSVLMRCGHKVLPQEVSTSDDPFDVLRYARLLGMEEFHEVEQALTECEVAASETATPTAGAEKLIESLAARHFDLAIVSNNSADAIRSYMNRHGLVKAFKCITGREGGPENLKPAPTPILKAMHDIGRLPHSCLLIGDSASDMVAAKKASSLALGYANKPHKAQTLFQAGADAVVTQLESVQRALDSSII